MTTDLFSTEHEESEMTQPVGTAADEAVRSQADAEPPAHDSDELLDRLNEPLPTTIRFESEGDRFVGRYVRLDQGMTAYGQQWIMVMADDNGELFSLWLLHAALVAKLKRLKPKPGDRIGVKYLGKRTSGSGNDYADYKVVSDAESAKSFGWGDVPGPDDDDFGDDAAGFDSEPPPF